MRFFKQLYIFILASAIILFAGGARVASHFCNGKVVSKSFNLKIEKCKKDKSVVPFTNHPIVSKSSCCDTQVDLFKSSNFEKVGFKTIEIQGDVSHPIQKTHHESQVFSIITELLRPPPNGRPIYIINERFII
jgi:hypothetical protein